MQSNLKILFFLWISWTFRLVAQSPEIFLTPADSGLFVQDTIRYAIRIKNAPPIGSFEFKLKFRTQIVSVDSLKIGPFLGSTGRFASQIGPTRFQEGEWSVWKIAGISFGKNEGAKDNGEIASFNLIGLKIGETPLLFEDFMLTNTSGQRIAVTQIKGGSVTVWPSKADIHQSYLIADPPSIPANGNSTSRITVIPVDSTGQRLPAGQKVEIRTTAGHWLADSVQRHPDGRYTRMLCSPTQPGTAMIAASVNDRILAQQVLVTFYQNPVGARLLPSRPIVNQGEKVTLMVELDSVWNVAAFQFDLEYQTRIIRLDSIWIGDFLSRNGREAGTGKLIVNEETPAGVLSFSGFSFGKQSGGTGSGQLAIIRFQTLGIGTSDIKIKNLVLTDPKGEILPISIIRNSFLTVQAIQIDADKSKIQVNPAEIPADGITTSLITIRPYSRTGEMLPPGQQVRLFTTAGTLLDSLSPSPDGSYQQRLCSSRQPETATLSAAINGVPLKHPATVEFKKRMPLNVKIEPMHATLTLNQSIVARIQIENGGELAGFEFKLSYLSQFVQVDSVWPGPFLVQTGRKFGKIGPFFTHHSDTGGVKFGCYSRGDEAGATGSGSLAFFKLRAIHPGETFLKPENVVLTNKEGLVWHIDSIQSGKISIVTGMVSSAHSFAAAEDDSLPADGIAFTKINIIPCDLNGDTLAAGQLVELETSAGDWVGPVKSHENGIYTRILRAAKTPAAAIVRVKVNGTGLKPIQVIFYPPPPTVIRIAPADTTIHQLGHEFEIRVEVDRVFNLGGFELALAFSKDVVKYENIKAGSFIEKNGRNTSLIQEFIKSSNSNFDTLKIAGFSFGEPAGGHGNGALVKICFSALKLSETAVNLSHVKLLNVEGKLLALHHIKNGRLVVSQGQVDPRKSTIVVRPGILPADNLSTATIIVVPKDQNGYLMGANQTVTLKKSGPGTLLGTGASYTPNGEYVQQIRAGNVTGRATIQATINGIDIESPAALEIVPATRLYFFSDSVYQPAGKIFPLEIRLEKLSRFLPNLSKIKFSVRFSNPNWIQSVPKQIEPGDYFGPADAIYFDPLEQSPGRITIETGRKDGNAASDTSGIVARIDFYTDLYTPDSTVVLCIFDNVSASDATNQPVHLNQEKISLTIRGIEVWPGDTNNDGVVDHFDLLPIGQCYGQKGPVRTNAGTSWRAQYCTRWKPLEATYSDANGDGLVDNQDAAVIDRNWKKNHGRLEKNIPPVNLPSAPELAVNYQSAETIEISIHKNSEPAFSGIGFTLEYLASRLEFIADAFGKSSAENALYFVKDEPLAGRLFLSRVELNPQNTNKHPNLIANLAFKTKNESGHQAGTIEFNLIDCQAMDSTATFVKLQSAHLQIFTTGESLPAVFTLKQNYPNPFNDLTVIEYEIPGAAQVVMAIYDVLGNEVRTLINQRQPAGPHQVTWDAKNQAGQAVPSGFYFVKIDCGQFSGIQKCLYLK